MKMKYGIAFLMLSICALIFTGVSGISTVYATSKHSIIYTKNLDTLFALRSDNGSVIWQKHFEARLDGLTPTGNSVYFPLRSGSVVAVSAETGEIRWQIKLVDSTTTGHVVLSITVYNDILVASLSNGLFYALNTRDGHLLWKGAFSGCSGATSLSATEKSLLENFQQEMSQPHKRKLTKQSLGIAGGGDPELERCIALSVKQDNGILYAYDGPGGGLYALRMSDGNFLWHNAEILFPFAYWFEVADRQIYAPYSDGGIAILNAANGQMKRVLQPQEPAAPYSPPNPFVVAGNRLYVLESGLNGSFLSAYQLEHVERLLFHTNLVVDIPLSGLSTEGDQVYAYGSGIILDGNGQIKEYTDVYAFATKDATERWHWHIDRGEGIGEPIFTHKQAFFGTFLGGYTLNTDTGKLNWHISW